LERSLGDKDRRLSKIRIIRRGTGTLKEERTEFSQLSAESAGVILERESLEKKEGMEEKPGLSARPQKSWGTGSICRGIQNKRAASGTRNQEKGGGSITGR